MDIILGGTVPPKQNMGGDAPLIPISLIARVYNKERGRVSYSSMAPATAVVRVQARSMIFTVCGTIHSLHKF